MDEGLPDGHRELGRQPPASARASPEAKAPEGRGQGERGGRDVEGGLVGRDTATAGEGETGQTGFCLFYCLQQSAKDLGITRVAVIVRLGGKGLKKF